MKSIQQNEGAAKAAIVAGTSAAMLIFSRNSDNVGYEIRMDLEKLPWQSDSFRRAVLKAAWSSAVYRSESARKAIRELGLPIVDTTVFVGIMEGITYQGEAAPNKADKDQAKLWLTAIAAGKFTEEQIRTKLKDKGFEWDKTEDGLVNYFFQERQKKEAEMDLGSL